MANALSAAKLHDGYVAYPWQKKMKETLSIPSSSYFLSILFLPKASDKVAHRYNDLEDTLSRANAWHTASQTSGVPIVFMNIQTESLLTKISGETASSTVNAGSLSDLVNLANVSLYGFEDYHGVDIGVVRGVRLWFAPIGGEVPVEIQIKEGDLKLGFAIGRTEEVRARPGNLDPFINFNLKKLCVWVEFGSMKFTCGSEWVNKKKVKIINGLN